MARTVILGLVGAALLAGCHEEPDFLCDRARIVWPPFAVDPSADTGDAPGIQIDVALRTALPEGSVGVLSVIAPDGTPTPHREAAEVDADGGMVFHGVTFPEGRIQLSLVVENRCGQVSSVRETYVWDGRGYPACELAFENEPVARPLYPAVFNRSLDDEGGVDGFQTVVSVAAGRPDMIVSLFVRDLATGVDEVYQQPTGDDDAAEFSLTFGEGERSIRAVCAWEPEDLRPSSVTRRFVVDTVAPDCALTEPATAVTPADDLDGNADGIQFAIAVHSGAADVAGEVPSFEADGAPFLGSAMSDGDGAAIATVVAPGPHDLSVVLTDHAGNECTDAVVR